jgi:hypothetical protein
MWYAIFSTSSGLPKSMSPINRCATEVNASCGHEWTQSITEQLISAGNFRHLKIIAISVGHRTVLNIIMR